MDDTRPQPLAHGTLIDHETTFGVDELGRACRLTRIQIQTWVDEGVVTPAGANADEWRFDAEALRRLRVAARLARDLDVNPPGVALALQLMDEIAALRARLVRR